MKSSKLQEILESTRGLVAARRKMRPLKELENAAHILSSKRSHCSLSDRLLSAQRPQVIAEVKFKSPSQGTLKAQVDPISIAKSYVSHGAAALSVLTEEKYFNGSLDYLKSIRKECPGIPILMKDFVVDPYQIYEGYLAGADLVLLIVAALPQGQLTELHALAQSLGLEVLVEVHDEEELRRANSLGAQLVGVNNRNLKTLAVDLTTSEKLISQIPKTSIAISESGFENSSDIQRFYQMGYRGFLIGSHFMKQPDPGIALQKILEDA